MAVQLKSLILSFLIVASYINLSFGASGHIPGRLRASDLAALRTSIQTFLSTNEDLIPGIVRLVFTDCIGICDGCINKDLEENRGLEAVVNSLETLMASWPGTRADMWATAAEEAIYRGIEINNEYCDTMTFNGSSSKEYKQCYTEPQKFKKSFLGRDDCPGGPFTAEQTDLPRSNWTLEQIRPWFWKHFRKNPGHFGALMGAHSLGGVRRPDLNRTWVPENPNGLGKQYYINMVDDDRVQDWVQVNDTDNGEFYWESGADPKNTGFALTSDMALTKNITRWAVDTQTGEVSREWRRLSNAWWSGRIRRYARGTGKWSKDFIRHFGDVMQSGYALFRPWK